MNQLKEQLTDLEELFQPFKLAIDVLQGDKYITAVQVLPQLAKVQLSFHCDGDSDFKKEAKTKLALSYQLFDVFCPHFLKTLSLPLPLIDCRYTKDRDFSHFAAASFLEVSQKNFHFAPSIAAECTTAAKAAIQVLCKRKEHHVPENQLHLPTMASLRAIAERRGRGLQEDLAFYETEVPTVAREEPWRPLQTFRELQLPQLEAAASCFWSIPATSASSERVFSLMGRIDKMAHSRLTEDKFEHQTFLKANFVK